MDQDLIDKILYTLPKEYENTVELIQSKLDSYETVTLYQLAERLRAKHELIMCRSGARFGKEGEEKALVSKKKGFKGQCNFCLSLIHI